MKTRPLSDPRFTITREFTGHESGKPQFVVRFCGEWIGSRQFYASALTLAVGEKARRENALTVSEIPA